METWLVLGKTIYVLILYERTRMTKIIITMTKYICSV